jgi:O-antigen/teichoic acid export membrane protein
MTQPGLTGKAVSGVAWSMSYQVGRQLLSFASVAVLARKVPPSAYGLLSMAAVITNFLETFRDMGTGNVIVREREVSDRLLSSVFWLNLGLGLVLALAVALLAFPAAAFFRESALTKVMQALAVIFLVYSLGVLPTGLLNREMAFRPIAISQLVGAVFGTAAAITAALLGAGVWSLVLGTLVSTLLATVGLWIACSWRPSLLIDWREIGSIASYSLHLSGFNFLNYFSRNADNLIVGRFLGDVALGYYQMAYTLMTYPLSNISSVIAGALFPAFSTLQDDDERFRSAFIRTSMLVGAVTIPAMLGLMVVAGPFVEVVLGAKWRSVVGLLVVFAPLGMFQSLYTLTGLAYYAKKRSDLLLRWGLISGVVYLASFFAGLPWGIQGIANSYSLAWILLMVPGFSIPFRLVGLSWREFLSSMWPELAAGVAMSLVALAWRLALNWAGISNSAAHLFSTAAVGCAAYVGLLLWWKPTVVSEAAVLLEGKGYLRLARMIA